MPQNNSDVKNYRSISSLSESAKMFKKIVYLKIFQHVRPKMCVQQHGFLKNQSDTNLLTS